jgi:hypothetical protein
VIGFADFENLVQWPFTDARAAVYDARVLGTLSEPAWSWDVVNNVQGVPSRPRGYRGSTRRHSRSTR